MLAAINSPLKKLELPAAIKKFGIPEKDFLDKVDKINELAFDDQCTGTNPRYHFSELD
jgi:acetaldehyde dehydrogenase / alcohol dehydrogenase